MGKEVVQGIFVGLAMVGIFVVFGNYVGANLHGGGHGAAKGEKHQKKKKGSHADGEAHGDKGGSHAKGHAKNGHAGGSTGWGGYLLGLLLHVLWFGIPSYLVLGVVALSEYFDRIGLDWWRAYVPGYNVWAFATREPEEAG